MQLTVEAMIAEGGTVAVRYTERGTFRAPAFGQLPTGQTYELVAMEWLEIAGGRIERRWGARNAATRARQLSLIPVLNVGYHRAEARHSNTCHRRPERRR